MFLAGREVGFQVHFDFCGVLDVGVLGVSVLTVGVLAVGVLAVL